MNQQKRLDEFASGQSARERIKLSAITNLAKQLFRLIGRNTENRDAAASGPQQSRHQIHQRRLPRSVWPNQTGDARAQSAD